MKYALTHCYTDKNKGDAAIIIATVQLIKHLDKDAKINMFSTYGPRDKRLHEDHKIIKPYADNLYPGLFYDPEPVIANNDKSRLISFVIIAIKSILQLISVNPLYLKIILNKEEYKAVYALLGSDIIISKGGSYLTTQNTGIRQFLSFIRMLYPFIFAKRYSKKIVIFSQSLGPVCGRFNQWVFLKTLQNINGIYLRESLCLDEYPVVKKLCQKLTCKVIPDTAFYLKREKKNVCNIDMILGTYNAGYTIVDHAFKYISSESEREKKIESYKKSIVDSMTYLMDEKGALIHIFPQVLVDNSSDGHNDAKISKEIVARFKNTKYEKNVVFYDFNLTPIELKELYSKMDVFIGTRLHSVIFAFTEGIPAINISYHGTKSQGILNMLDKCHEFVINIDTIHSELLITKLKKLTKTPKDVWTTFLQEKVAINSTELEKAMKEVIDGSHC